MSSFVLHLSLKNDVDVAPGCSWSRKPDETHRGTYIVHRVSVLHTADARAAWRNRMPFNTSVASVFFCLLSYTRLYRTKCVHHHDDHRKRPQLACYPRILATLLLYLVSTGYAASSNIKQKTKNLANRIGPALCKRVTEIFLQYTLFSRCSRIVLHTRTHASNPDLPIWGGGPSSVAIG